MPQWQTDSLTKDPLTKWMVEKMSLGKMTG
jgi:hypothetical protein